MTHGANAAFVDLCRRGNCTSGSIMVPCPWFPEAAAIQRENPAFDLGVHLTLTSEKVPYRWRPLTRPGRSAGLTDADGYFWATIPELRQNADPAAVEDELRAQIETALAAGVNVTHLDCHMGGAMMPEFVERYYQLGLDYDVPVLLVKDLSQFNPVSYAGPIATEPYDAVVSRAREDGHPVFDVVIESPWERTDDARSAYRRLFEQIPEGLTYLALHFNDVGDFEVIEPDKAHVRTEEYAFFKEETIHQWAGELDIDFIGMRALRETTRG